MEAVSTQRLVKRYGAFTALSDVDLTVHEGELFGLLGVNGAGKTTLIRILSGLTVPSSGEAYVLGRSVRTEAAAVKRLIDISPQETSVAPKLTVGENLAFFASIYYDGKAAQRERIEEITRSFGLEKVLDQRAGRLSGGWQRRLSIAIALLSRPKVLFLDEPTLGLDVLARRELWEVIEGLKGKVTVLLTSHYLEEIEALCDRVAILAAGRILIAGTPREIEAAAGVDRFEDAFVKLVREETK